jgi:class 3 adenylate cyclase
MDLTKPPRQLIITPDQPLMGEIRGLTMLSTDQIRSRRRESYMASGSSLYRAIFGVDVAGFGHPSRDDNVQIAIRRALYGILEDAWIGSGYSWDECLHEDRGDGVLIIAPPSVPLATLIDPMLHLIRAGLRRHNKLSSEPARIRLAAALHAGHVRCDDYGVAGVAVNHMFRLLDAIPLRNALNEPFVDLAFVASEHIYDAIIKTASISIEPEDYLPIDVHVKETRTRAFITIPTCGRRPAQVTAEREMPTSLSANLPGYATLGKRLTP